MAPVVYPGAMRFVLASLVALAAASSCGGNVVVEPGADAGSTLCTGDCCTSDADCAADSSCDTATGVCVTGDPICVSDADCAAGETCDTATGTCVGTNVPSCQQCACIDLLSMGGCANVCKMGLNGTSTPNFCDGVAALPQCAKCLADLCGSLPNPPNPSNPSACM